MSMNPCTVTGNAGETVKCWRASRNNYDIHVILTILRILDYGYPACHSKTITKQHERSNDVIKLQIFSVKSQHHILPRSRLHGRTECRCFMWSLMFHLVFMISRSNGHYNRAIWKKYPAIRSIPSHYPSTRTWEGRETLLWGCVCGHTKNMLTPEKGKRWKNKNASISQVSQGLQHWSDFF